MVAVLLMSGVASAQTPTAPKESAEVAAIRVKANAGDADAQSNLGVRYDLGSDDSLRRDIPTDHSFRIRDFRS